MDNDWVKIYTSASYQEAELVRQLLVENGVEAVLMNKQDSSYLFGVIHVFIPAGEFDRATELIISKEL